MHSKPLEGIKIVDFGWAIVGPLTVRYLADFGAQVIRVESGARLDLLRTWGPFKNDVPGINKGGAFALYHAGKWGVTLNLSHPRAPEVLKKIVAWADVLLESFTPGVTKRLGLSYEDITQTKPDIIMVSTSTQGQTGPHAVQPGVGWAVADLAGLQFLCGWPDRDPSFIYGAYTDFIAPHFLVPSILAALDYRRRTGKGVHLDQSQYESSIFFVAPAVLDYAINRRQMERDGNRSPCAAPHGVYHCQGDDRWCAIAVFSDAEWQRFCDVIGNPTWTNDPRFSTLLSRKKNEDELDKLITEWTAKLPPEKIAKVMQEAGVPCEIVATAEDMFNDKQLEHRRHFQVLDHPEIGQHACECLGFRFSKTPYQLQRAPCLGEHNEYVYTKVLGFTDDEFVELLSDGAFE